MLSLAFAILALNTLVANALPKQHKCGRPRVTSNSTTVASSISLVETSSQTLPTVSSVVSIVLTSAESSTADDATSAPSPTSTSSLTTTSESVVAATSASSTADDATSAPSPTSTSSLTTTSESAVAATSASSTTLEATSTDSLIEATQVAGLRASDHCGTDDRLILPGFAWTVSNAMYNADQMVGTQCTNFEAVLQTTDGTQDVQWNSVTDIDFVESTKDLCKGYSNIGIGVNLKKQLKDITSIPASFRWERSNTTDFRGANVFDFITAPTAGDSSSTSTSEFMLWLQIWGNQVPIGYASGPVATFDLYDASWRLYEGVNPASGVTVRSMLVDTAFDGEFQGDLKDWLEAMVQAGYIADTDYVNVGNAGSEVFYGSAVMNATVSLNINI